MTRIGRKSKLKYLKEKQKHQTIKNKSEERIVDASNLTDSIGDEIAEATEFTVPMDSTVPMEFTVPMNSAIPMEETEIFVKSNAADTSQAPLITYNEEDDCGVSDETMLRMQQRLSYLSGIETITIRDSSLEKMSEVLLEYAEPLLDIIDIDNYDQYERALKTAGVFWNLSVLNLEPKARKSAVKLLKLYMTSTEINGVMLYMHRRKQQLFPDNNRIITDIDIVAEGGHFHVSVASTIPEKK